ncbi:MAG TPA: type III pantothenate kinase [Anaerolineales bacterium]|nr:type III pantothenate kinase [Anaerolineales bacterium]
MLLAIDVGNTNITLGLYRGEDLVAAWRLATAHERMPDEYGLQLLGLLEHAGIGPQEIDGSALASVVPPLTAVVLQACERYLGQKPLVVDAGIKTGVRIRYDDPKAVGADRIADAAAARKIYGVPACVVDFGTATTFNAISAEGDYLGGAIAPGIGIAVEALFQRTAKLPRVGLARPPAAIGRNTVHAIQSGMIFGYVGLVEGMVKRFRDELGGDTKVIATGGLAPIIAAETDILQFHAPWLTLEGLKIIWGLNQ